MLDFGSLRTDEVAPAEEQEGSVSWKNEENMLETKEIFNSLIRINIE